MSAAKWERIATEAIADAKEWKRQARLAQSGLSAMVDVIQTAHNSSSLGGGQPVTIIKASAVAMDLGRAALAGDAAAHGGAASAMLAALTPFAAGFPNTDRRDYERAGLAVAQARAAGIVATGEASTPA